MIKEALLSLIQTKEFSKITIQNIANQALINRATFYLHFLDKYDLLDKITEEVFHELSDLIKPTSYIIDNSVDSEKLQNMLILIFESVNNNISFYKAILGNYGVIEIKKKLHELIKSKFKSEFSTVNSKGQIDSEFIAQFTTSALLGMIIWWVESEQMYSTKYMAKTLTTIILNGPLQAIGFESK